MNGYVFNPKTGCSGLMLFRAHSVTTKWHCYVAFTGIYNCICRYYRRAKSPQSHCITVNAAMSAVSVLKIRGLKSWLWSLDWLLTSFPSPPLVPPKAWPVGAGSMCWRSWSWLWCNTNLISPSAPLATHSVMTLGNGLRICPPALFCSANGDLLPGIDFCYPIALQLQFAAFAGERRDLLRPILSTFESPIHTLTAGHPLATCVRILDSVFTGRLSSTLNSAPFWWLDDFTG